MDLTHYSYNSTQVNDFSFLISKFMCFSANPGHYTGPCVLVIFDSVYPCKSFALTPKF